MQHEGLTLLQYGVLRLIDKGQATRLSDIAKALDLTPSSLSPVVDRLVQQGLVERSQIASDRRAYRLDVTERGRAAGSMLHEAINQTMRKDLASLTDAQVGTIEDGLQLLTDCVSQRRESQ